MKSCLGKSNLMSNFAGLTQAQRHLASVGEIICSRLELCQSPRYAQRHQVGRSTAKSPIVIALW